MTDRERHIINGIEKEIHTAGVSNDFLVQLIEVGGSHLNLMTISAYAKANQLTYNGVKKSREVRELFEVKFVIDNE